MEQQFMQLAEMAAQALQSQDPAAMGQVCQALVQFAQQMMQGAQQGSAPAEGDTMAQGGAPAGAEQAMYRHGGVINPAKKLKFVKVK